MHPALTLLPLVSLVGQAPLLDADAFTSRALTEAQRLFPAATAKIQAPLTLVLGLEGGKSTQVNLDNAFAEYQRQPDQLASILARYLGGVKEAREAAPGLDSSRIVPLVRPTAMLEAMAKQVQGKLRLVTESMGDDLSIVYAVDGQNTIKYLNEPDMKAAGLAGKDLSALGARNLLALIGQPRTATQDGVVFVAAKDGYESSLLAVPTFCESIRAMVKGELVVGVPARDLLFITGSENTASLAHLQDVVRRAHGESDHPLSPHLYVLRDGKLTRFQPH